MRISTISIVKKDSFSICNYRTKIKISQKTNICVKELYDHYNDIKKLYKNDVDNTKQTYL